MKRSSGLHPRKGGYVDEARILPANGDALALSVNLKHCPEVSCIAYITVASAAGDQSAAPSYEVRSAADDVLFTIPGGATGRQLLSRSGYELGELFGDITSVKLVEVGKAGTATSATLQVSLF